MYLVKKLIYAFDVTLLAPCSVIITHYNYTTKLPNQVSQAETLISVILNWQRLAYYLSSDCFGAGIMEIPDRPLWVISSHLMVTICSLTMFYEKKHGVALACQTQTFKLNTPQ